MGKYIKVFGPEVRTSSVDSRELYNSEGHQAAHLYVNITSGSNLVVTVKGKDRLSDDTYTLLQSSTLTGDQVLKIGPDYTAGANVAKDYIPETWMVSVTLSGSTNFSIGASLI